MPEERELAQRDLAGVARKRHEAQRQDRQGQAVAHREQVVAAEHSTEPDDHHHDGDSSDERRPGARHPGGPHPHHPTDGQANLGDEEQRQEQHDHGQRRVDIVAHPLGGVADGHGVGDAEDHGAQERHGQAAQTAHHRGGVAVDHELGERLDVHPLHARRQEDAPQAGEHDADHPGVGRDPARGRPRQRGQAGVVHHGAHGHAGAGAAEEHAQEDRHGDGHRHRDELLPREGDPRHRDGVAVEELGRVVGVGRRAPDDPRQGHEHEQQTQGDRQPDARGRPVQGAHDDSFHHDAEHGRRHHQDDGERHQFGQAPPLPQLPEEVRHHHAHGAVGEVEDARRVVGDHQTAGTHGVDGAEDDAGDEEAQKFGHRTTSPFEASPECRAFRRSSICSPMTWAGPSGCNRARSENGWRRSRTRYSVWVPRA